MSKHQTELYHHGVKGQKWGVRRYQNADGTYTSEGRARHRKYVKVAAMERYSESNPTSKKANKIATTAGIITMAAAAAIVASNPKARKVVTNAVKSLGKINGQKVTSMARKGKDYAQKAARQAKEGFKEGVKEGFKEGPKKFTKAVIGGAFMYGGKKLLDRAVGVDNAGRIMKANDKKKIGSFWSFTEQDKRDDDD